MQDWYVMSSPVLNSGFENDEWEENATSFFEEELTYTKLGQTVKLCSGAYDATTKTFETEYETKAIVQSETPDAYTQGWQRQIITKISDNLADYKYVKYEINGSAKIFVIMTMPSDNQIYTKAVMHLCNYTLKWQGKDGTVYYYPACILDATQYNTGVESVANMVRTGYVQLMAWLSLDEITAGIERDKRFFIRIFDSCTETYIVTSTSKIPYSYDGDVRVMRITFTECEYNPDVDRADLDLCDYIDKVPPSGDEPIIIAYKGEPQVRIGGQKTFYTDKDAIFELVVVPEFADKVVLTTVDARTCRIKADFDRALIGAHVRLKAYWHGQTAEQLIDVIGGV